MQKSVIIIGKGNAGTHLASLFGRKYQVMHISARSTMADAKAISIIPENTDLIILAVPDKFISGISACIPSTSAILVHTAGTANINLLQTSHTQYGVIYPFQTLRKEYSLYTDQIPLIIEGNNEETQTKLKSLCQSVSGSVYEMNSEQRRWLHVSGVFACNFVNHLYALASDLIVKQGLNHELLHPLIMETAMRAIRNGASVSQTGPAIRRDYATIKSHLSLLMMDEDLKEIYRLLTKSINNKHFDDELQEESS